MIICVPYAQFKMERQGAPTPRAPPRVGNVSTETQRYIVWGNEGKPHRPAAPGQRCYVSAPPTPPPTADARFGQNSCSSKLITAPSESSAISRSLGLKRHAKQGNWTNCVPFCANEFRFHKFCSLALHRRNKKQVSLVTMRSLAELP